MSDTDDKAARFINYYICGMLTQDELLARLVYIDDSPELRLALDVCSGIEHRKNRDLVVELDEMRKQLKAGTLKIVSSVCRAQDPLLDAED